MMTLQTKLKSFSKRNFPASYMSICTRNTSAVSLLEPDKAAVCGGNLVTATYFNSCNCACDLCVRRVLTLQGSNLQPQVCRCRFERLHPWRAEMSMPQLFTTGARGLFWLLGGAPARRGASQEIRWFEEVAACVRDNMRCGCIFHVHTCAPMCPRGFARGLILFRPQQLRKKKMIMLMSGWKLSSASLQMLLQTD